MKNVRVLQIASDCKDARYRKFASLRMLNDMGIKFDLSVYKEVYNGQMDINDAEDVFVKLQGCKPQGYKGHSLSVSDLVQIDNGDILFCDSFGFVNCKDIAE
jgi:hypothetical protein